MSEHMLYLSFMVWVTSLRMFFSSSIHLYANFNMTFFHSWVVLYCIHVLHFLYPCFGWEAPRLFPGSGYYKQCCYEHRWASFRYMPKWGIAGSWGRLISNFLKQKASSVYHEVDKFSFWYKDGSTAACITRRLKDRMIPYRPFVVELLLVAMA